MEIGIRYSRRNFGDRMTDDDKFEVIQELLSLIYIQNARMYDMLTLIAPQDKAIALSELHEQGKVIGPDPILIPDEDSE